MPVPGQGSSVARALATTTTSVNVSNAAAPTPGQTLQASGSTAALWQNNRLLNVKLSGAVGDDATFDTTDLATNDTTALAAGLSNYFPKGTYKVSGTVVFNAPCIFDVGAVIHVTAGSIAFNGGITAEITQILDLESGVTATFSKQKTIVGYAEWWGAISNDAATDCMAAINACLIAVTKTQLMPATYYTSGAVVNALGLHSLCGAVHNLYGSTESILMCTSSSATILTISGTSATGGTSAVEDVLAKRSVAPLISSDCIGVNVTAYYPKLRRVFSFDSMIGFKFNGTTGVLAEECLAQRTVAGSGAGTDTFKGFWMDGTSSGYGGNASLYTRKCMVATTTPFAGTSIGYYCDKKHSDLFFDHVETWHCTTGMEVYGDGMTRQSGTDFKVIHGVFDSCYGSALKISNTDSMATLSFTDLELSCATAGQKLLDISSSNGAITLQGTQYLSVGNTGAAISIVNSTNVDSGGGVIMEAILPVNMSGSSNCSLSDRTINNTYTGTGVKVATTSRCKFDMKMTGAVVGVGYKVLDATSGYNEFNCTGLDPTGITGGAANKLVINGTQVVAVGIAAAGHGTNVASGVMA